MAIQPTQPGQNQGLGKILTIGGAALGSMGGPSGAVAGAGAGQTAAGLLQKAPTPPVESQGMQRRQEELIQDPLRQIQQAQAAARKLSPDQMPEVRRAFDNAIAIAKQNQEFGRG
tara:strand:- start:120 stop:464 length:345 start_codon:yes stop_codon:yes gene_type:complete